MRNASRVTRGLFRLWLVLSVLWIGVVGLAFWRTALRIADPAVAAFVLTEVSSSTRTASLRVGTRSGLGVGIQGLSVSVYFLCEQPDQTMQPRARAGQCLPSIITLLGIVKNVRNRRRHHSTGGGCDRTAASVFLAIRHPPLGVGNRCGTDRRACRPLVRDGTRTAARDGDGTPAASPSARHRWTGPRPS